MQSPFDFVFISNIGAPHPTVAASVNRSAASLMSRLKCRAMLNKSRLSIITVIFTFRQQSPQFMQLNLKISFALISSNCTIWFISCSPFTQAF
jgi:hypothetical protein